MIPMGIRYVLALQYMLAILTCMIDRPWPIVLYHFSVAATIRVGNMLGAGKPEIAQAATMVSFVADWVYGTLACSSLAYHVTCGIFLLLMVMLDRAIKQHDCVVAACLFVMMFSCRHVLPRIFTSDSDVVEIAASVLLVGAFVQVMPLKP